MTRLASPTSDPVLFFHSHCPLKRTPFSLWVGSVQARSAHVSIGHSLTTAPKIDRLLPEQLQHPIAKTLLNHYELIQASPPNSLSRRRVRNVRNHCFVAAGRVAFSLFRDFLLSACKNRFRPRFLQNPQILQERKADCH